MEDVVVTHETFSAPDGTGSSRFQTDVPARRSGTVLTVRGRDFPGGSPRPGDRFHSRDVLTVIEAKPVPGGEYRCECAAGE